MGSVKSNERKYIYRDKNVLVVQPLTHTASCKYGAFTKWCTAVPETDTHFVRYTGDGVLIYFIIKNKLEDIKFAYYFSYDEHGKDTYGEFYDGEDDCYDYSFYNDDRTVDKKITSLISSLPKDCYNNIKSFLDNEINKNIKREKELKDLLYLKSYNADGNIILSEDESHVMFYREKNIKMESTNDEEFMEFRTIEKDLGLYCSIFLINKETKTLYVSNFKYDDELKPRNRDYYDFYPVATPDKGVIEIPCHLVLNSIKTIREKYYKGKHIRIPVTEITLKDRLYVKNGKTMIPTSIKDVDNGIIIFGRFMWSTKTDHLNLSKTNTYCVQYDPKRHNKIS